MKRNNINILIGTELTKARQKKKLSQGAVAKLNNITRQAVSNYELGKRKMNLSTFIIYCDNAGFDSKKIINKIIDLK